MDKLMQLVVKVIGIPFQMQMELARRDPLILPHATLRGSDRNQRNKGWASIRQRATGRACFLTQIVWLQAQGTVNEIPHSKFF